MACFCLNNACDDGWSTENDHDYCESSRTTVEAVGLQYPKHSCRYPLWAWPASPIE